MLKTVADDERDAAGRARLQSYEALPRFLPARLWQQIWDCQEPGAKLAASVDALGQLCLFLHKLGLKYPSEPTFARIYVLMHCRGQLVGLSPEQLTAGCNQCKGQVRAALTRFGGLPRTCPALLCLPSEPRQLSPEQWQQLYGQDALPEQPPVTVETLDVLQGSVRLRRRGSSSSSRSSSSGPGSAAALLAAFGVAAPAVAPPREPLPLPPPTPLLALEDRPAPVTQQNPSPAAVPAVAATAVPGAEESQDVTPVLEEETTQQPLQLVASAFAVSQAMDKKREDQAAAAGRAAAPTLDHAFCGMQREEGQEGAAATGRTSCSAKKRPAAARDGPRKRPSARVVEGPLRRPAAAELSAAKRPAAAAGALKRPAAAETRDDVLARVPPDLKKRFAKGCCSCRWRPLCCLSCWRKRRF